jgi:hypothetical protein
MSTEKSFGVDSLDSVDENEARNSARLAVPRLPPPLPLAHESRQKPKAKIDMTSEPSPLANSTSSSRAASEQQGYVPQGQISRIACG